MISPRRDERPSPPLWTQEEISRAPTGSKGASKAPSGSRDVDSMKGEIKELQKGTTESLDRAIAAAQATSSVGTRITENLHEQREQMGHIDADLRETDETLSYTGYNIKHGFTWRGALSAPFRKAIKKPGPVREVSPVFTDGYTGGKTPPRSPASRRAPAQSASGGAVKASATGRATASPRRNGGKEKAKESGASKPQTAGHVPEGFDQQLDVLDGLVDGLALQAQAIGDELRQQNEGIEVLGERLEPALTRTEEQSKAMKRRFRLRG